MLNRLRPVFLMLLGIGLSLSLSGCSHMKDLNSNETPTGMFIHVSHGPESPHRVLMALSMALKMSTDRPVAMYFDIEGVKALTADAPSLKLEPFDSSKLMLRQLIDRGVPVMACPGCLQAAGLSAESLAPGVEVASKEAFFSFTDGHVMTLDY